ncbi:ATP-binding protein [Streptomyces shaanxiensis]
MTNALRHAPGPCRLALTLVDDGVEIAVSDTGEGYPTFLPRDPLRVGGHGLEIVTRLCDEVITKPHATGKTVYAGCRCAEAGPAPAAQPGPLDGRETGDQGVDAHQAQYPARPGAGARPAGTRRRGPRRPRGGRHVDAAGVQETHLREVDHRARRGGGPRGSAGRTVCRSCRLGPGRQSHDGGRAECRDDGAPGRVGGFGHDRRLLEARTYSQLPCHHCLIGSSAVC